MPISSLALRFVISVLLLDCYLVKATSLYALQDSYEGSSFFDDFDFFTQSDPTHGFVQYVDNITARNSGLISSSANSTYIGVDHRTIYPLSSPGRPSVRIQSKKTYTHGLFIADIAHMPGGVCGTWPAFWTVGSNWPNNGEIDILEGVNQAADNLISMHTSTNCTVAGTGETGTLITNNCYVDAMGQPSNSGCAVTSTSTKSYGTGFNTGQGGVYAMEWTSDAIKIWFFPRGSIPASIDSGLPDTSTFGTPTANFQGSCNIDSHFADHRIVFDTTFCGDYAGNVWASGSCSTLAATCVEYVANNPGAFANVFWSINSLKVFRLLISNTTSSSSYISSATPVASTSSITAAPVGMGRTSTISSKGSSTSAPSGPSGAPITGFNSTFSTASISQSYTESNITKSSMTTLFTKPGSFSNSSTSATASNAMNLEVVATLSGSLNGSTVALSLTISTISSFVTSSATATAATQTSTVRLCRAGSRKQQRPALLEPVVLAAENV